LYQLASHRETITNRRQKIHPPDNHTSPMKSNILNIIFTTGQRELLCPRLPQRWCHHPGGSAARLDCDPPLHCCLTYLVLSGEYRKVFQEYQYGSSQLPLLGSAGSRQCRIQQAGHSLGHSCWLTILQSSAAILFKSKIKYGQQKHGPIANISIIGWRFVVSIAT